jgi:hypothetical protein
MDLKIVVFKKLNYFLRKVVTIRRWKKTRRTKEMTDNVMIVKSNTDLNGQHDEIENRRRELIREGARGRIYSRDFSKRTHEITAEKPSIQFDVEKYTHDRYFANYEGMYPKVPSSRVCRIVLGLVSDELIEKIFQEYQIEAEQYAIERKEAEEAELKRIDDEKQAAFREEEEKKLRSVSELQKMLQDEVKKNKSLQDQMEWLYKELGVRRLP